MQCSISDISWQQAPLSFRFGGLGLCESAISASPAFLGSCDSNCLPFRQLILISSAFLMRRMQPDIFDDHSLFAAPASQIDKRLFGHLYASFGIQDQARLNALKITPFWHE